MISKRAKACDITPKVKKIVFQRDGFCCIMCGSPYARPNAHYISRAKGGLGVPENVVTLCVDCHNKTDQSTERKECLEFIENYLKSKYKNWDKGNLIYKK